jgi:hypothetical protein
VGRILKSIMSVKHLPAEIETALPAEIEGFLPKMMPTAFYQTWSRDEFPSFLSDIVQQAGGKKVVALTALVATIGEEPEDALSEMLMNGETQRSQMVQAISEESADLCLNFLSRLLAEEAAGDDCEVSEPILVEPGETLAETLELLDAGEEGVSLDTAYHLSPRFTRVALSVWWPVARKKKAASARKRSA